jgi:hypothetical protein
MKYSLRSLMIGITLFCVLLGGRIEYLRRGATYHEQEAHRWAMQMKEETGYDPEKVPVATMFRVPHFLYSQFEAHERLAREYRHAVYHPWETVQAPMPPKDEQEMYHRILSDFQQEELRKPLPSP